MNRRSPKAKCCTGRPSGQGNSTATTDGRVYDPADPCPPGSYFDPEICNCRFPLYIWKGKLEEVNGNYPTADVELAYTQYFLDEFFDVDITAELDCCSDFDFQGTSGYSVRDNPELFTPWGMTNYAAGRESAKCSPNSECEAYCDGSIFCTYACAFHQVFRRKSDGAIIFPLNSAILCLPTDIGYDVIPSYKISGEWTRDDAGVDEGTGVYGRSCAQWDEFPGPDDRLPQD